jgi:hypothetical protein
MSEKCHYICMLYMLVMFLQKSNGWFQARYKRCWPQKMSMLLSKGVFEGPFFRYQREDIAKMTNPYTRNTSILHNIYLNK